MAKPPGSLDKINYVIRFLMDPCDAPFSIYVRTLWPALLEAFLTWYALDMVQIFTGWIRPGGGKKKKRGLNHEGDGGQGGEEEGGKSKKASGKRTWLKKWARWTGFDPWEELGKRLPLGEGLRARSVTPGVQTLWNIYGLEQRLMYWVMVYEVTSEFFYKWASGVAQSWYCQQQYTPWVFTAKDAIADPGAPGGAGILLNAPTKARWGGCGPGNAIWVDSVGSTIHIQATRTSPEDGRPMRLKVIDPDGNVFVGNEVYSPLQQMVCGAATGSAGTWYVIFEAFGLGSAEKMELSLIGTPVGNNPYGFPPSWDTPFWEG